MLSLKRLGLINRGSRGMRLSIIMDSKYCQVHNGHVVQLALLLVELSYFQAVEFIFHIDGHGNYICDNMFKRLNKIYQDSNVFNMEVLFNLFNQLDNITYHNVAMESLYDYKHFFLGFTKMLLLKLLSIITSIRWSILIRQQCVQCHITMSVPMRS